MNTIANPQQESEKPKTIGFDHILAPVRRQMEALEDFFDAEIEHFEPELRECARYVIEKQGKRIRPLLVFYSGWKSDPEPDADLVRAAAVLELVHLATLVHDDILDGAEMRHRVSTAVSKYGSSVAVLLGDALFAHALNLASDFPTTEVCRIVSAATRRVCAGEIKQTFSAREDDFNRADYDRVIELKTAELFRASCYLGARLAGYPEDFVNASAEFGLRLGTAYQVFDDMADFFGTEKSIGKTLGTDLANGKRTLPLFALMDSLPKEKSRELRSRIHAGTVEMDHITALMEEYAIYETVREHFLQEIATGEAALHKVKPQPPLPFLIEMGRAVRQQMSRLR